MRYLEGFETILIFLLQDLIGSMSHNLPTSDKELGSWVRHVESFSHNESSPEPVNTGILK